jgi:alcohol dehydrogenase (cytochrome c)
VGCLDAQVFAERLLQASKEPHNWLSYSGTYSSHRHSTLNQVTPANAKNLELKWVFQAASTQKFEATPLVVDGVMYLTQPPNDLVALDAKTGRIFWIYEHRPSPEARVCCGAVNRGLAIHGDTLFMGTIDARLIAIDAKGGKPLWNIQIADPKLGYALALAPLVIKDKVIVGTAGGEYGIRGFISAHNVRTGEELWRFYTIPGPGEPGNETWAGDSWKYGGASIWVTGSYDPELNLTYWGVGNPGPDWNIDSRKGDNLYSDSVVALDADTGKLKWYFQFTPHDAWDYDSVQIPVLVDMDWQGRARKLMLWANRNGFFYVLDRVTGEFLLGRPFVKQTWAIGLDEKGRPIKAPNMEPSPEGTKVYPGVQGGTNWYSPSYSPRTGLFYIPAWVDYYSNFVKLPVKYEPGRLYLGGNPKSPVPSVRRGPIRTWTEADGRGAVLAIDPRTGDRKWEFKMTDVTDSGVLTTASDLLFTGGREGYFYALNARTGQVLWNASLGGQIAAGPITYGLNGKQYISIAAGHSLFTFGLRE